jgi:hypothetical protein
MLDKALSLQEQNHNHILKDTNRFLMSSYTSIKKHFISWDQKGSPYNRNASQLVTTTATKTTTPWWQEYSLHGCDVTQSGKEVPTIHRNLLSPFLHTYTIQRQAQDIIVMLILIYQTTWCHIPQGCNTNESACINSFHLHGLLPKRNLNIIDITDSSVNTGVLISP